MLSQSVTFNKIVSCHVCECSFLIIAVELTNKMRTALVRFVQSFAFETWRVWIAAEFQNSLHRVEVFVFFVQCMFYSNMYHFWLLLLLLLLVPGNNANGFLFGLFDTKPKCDAPFANAPSWESSLKKIWNGFWSCPYEPTANPGQTIDNFVRYFYIESGQSQFSAGSATEIAKLINKNHSNHIITHGFDDGVRIGGTYIFIRFWLLYLYNIDTLKI